MPTRLRLAVVTVLVAGGAVATAFFVWPRGNHVAACGGPTVAPLSAQGQKALDLDSTSIRYDSQKSSNGGRLDTWIDPVTGATRILSFDNQGRLTSETGQTWVGKSLKTVVVSFATRSSISATTPMSRSYSNGDDGAVANSLGVRRGLADGTMTVLGHAVIDGRATLHLRQSVLQLWVDPLTYLPVHTQAGPTSDDFTWLPRTASNLLSTRIVVPQGFTQALSENSASTTQRTTTCAQP
jgi:hypothetical protein